MCKYRLFHSCYREIIWTWGGHLWYLSASLFAGALVVFLISLLKEKWTTVSVIICCVLYNYIFNNFSFLDVWHNLAFNGMVQVGLVRAVADISLGTVIRKISDKLPLAMKYAHRFFIIFVCTFFFIFLEGIAIYFPHTKGDIICIAFFVCILICINRLPYLSCGITKLLDKLCLPMYIFQVIAIYITNYFVINSIAGAVITIIVDLLISIGWIVFYNSNIYKRIINKIRGGIEIC